MPKVHLKLVVAVPEFPLSTRAARNVLPDKVALQDAVFNIGRASMMVAALYSDNVTFLQHVFEDALHQPYRAKLIPGMYDVFKAARKAGAIGASISGAGPCLIAFTVEKADEVGQAMVRVLAQHDIEASYLAMDIDSRGVHVI